MNLKNLAAKKQEERKLIKEVEKQIQGQLTVSDNRDVLDIINNIYLPDIVTRYVPCLRLASDGRNFTGCNNEDYKAMFYDSSKNLLISNGCHYISDKSKGYNPFYFVREHFCNGNNAKTYTWFKDNYPNEMSKVQSTNIDSAHYYELKPQIRSIEDEQNLDIVNFNDVASNYIEYRRKLDVDKMCKYGIRIVDDHLGGIMDSELVVIGAETGIGKSELAYISAMHNAINGKRVMLLSLEGDIAEIAARHLHKNINAKLDFDKKVKVPVYRFNLDKNIYSVEDRVFEDMKQKLKDNLWLFDKKNIPTIGAIKKLITTQKDNFDLIIIDHLHYIYLGDTIQENAAIGGVMRELKTITDIIKKPILLVSHLRKKTTDAKKKSEPDLNDLYGSSNIAKEATTILFVLKDDMDHHHFGFDLDPLPEYQGGYLALTKIKLLKSRSGLAVPTSFHLVYDRLGKKYLDEHQQIIEEESATKEGDGITSLNTKIKGTFLD